MDWMLLPLKRYAEFSGRSRRMEFWMFTLGVFLLYLVFMVIAMAVGIGAAGMAASAGGSASVGGLAGMFASMGILAIVLGIVWLGLLIPTIAVAIRRLHDTNRSGFWLWIYIGPYLVSLLLNIMAVSSNSSGMAGLAGVIGLLGLIGAIVLLVFYCLPGTPGPNKYGPDPMGGSAANLGDTFA
ncbi:MAG: DUF805 domain-containing protein [Proteobacteria bacterium]|nr:DUF805 domain-containing protein [Pseudomonadota bacterium]